MDFSQISILLGVAAIFGIIAKRFKQPLLVGYLFAGFVLAFFGIVADIEVFSGLGQIGVALLLFLLGLEMNIRELPAIGKVALLTGAGQIVFTAGVGYILATLLGFPPLASLYIAIALTFSSTIIMVKLLSEKRDLASLYGRIAIGVLLIQDFIAVLILVFLAGLGRGELGFSNYILTGAKAGILFVLVWTLSKKALPNIFEKLIARSSELLFIGSIAWALGVASFVAGPLGFTFEIGGFLAGLALSNMPEHLQIAARTRPLRDFFLTIFFLLLGTKLVVSGLGEIAGPAFFLLIFVLVGKPIIVLVILGLIGYKKRTSFLAGLSVAQVSEFSLILMVMGQSLSHVAAEHVALVTLVGALTMTASTYMILGAEKIYLRLKDYLSIFERKKTYESAFLKERPLSDHIVMVGCERTGSHLLPFFIKRKWPLLVVDFNPTIFRRLTAENVPVLFGDIGDEEVIELAKIDKAQLVISTISNLYDNLTILEYIKNLKTAHPTTMFTARGRDEAVKYYEAQADYVIVPQEVTGEHLRHIFKIYGTSGKILKKLGRSQFNRLIAK